MYRQSLGSRLSDEDGQILVQTDAPEILDEDVVSGYIYVLRSRSADPQIAALKDLHKIGFTRDAVESRIKNAEKPPTYLMAPVDVVASYRTYNLKVSALENLLHRVFAEVRLDLTQARPQGPCLRPAGMVRRTQGRHRSGDRPDPGRRHRRLRLGRAGTEARGGMVGRAGPPPKPPMT